MRGTDSPLFAHEDAEALKNSLTPLRPWAPLVITHAGVGADGISALAPQTKLCHRRIRSHRLDRSTGRVGSVQGLGCRLIGDREKWELKSRMMKGKNYSPSFPSSGIEGANPPWHGTDRAVMLILLPFPCTLQGKCLLLLNLELAVPRAKDELVVQMVKHLFHFTWSHALIYLKKFLSFYFTDQLLCKSLGVLRCLTVKIHMMHLHSNIFPRSVSLVPKRHSHNWNA